MEICQRLKKNDHRIMLICQYNINLSLYMIAKRRQWLAPFQVLAKLEPPFVLMLCFFMERPEGVLISGSVLIEKM